jgi:hypothetical protein
LLTRLDFESAVKDALRHYTQADLLAENALLRTRLLMRPERGAATPQALRTFVAETAKTLFAGERDQRLYRVLDLTYLNPAPKQEAAADRLGLSFSTYRRHLTAGVDRTSHRRRGTFRTAAAATLVHCGTAVPEPVAGSE